MKKKDFLFFFALPFGGILLLFFLLSSFDRTFVKNKTEQLAREQLLATAQILKVGVARALDEGTPPDGILRRYAGEESIYFMALFDENDEILDWISRFEGYLPYSRETAHGLGTWVIDSPAGKILNIFSTFSAKSGPSYHLFLGYSLKKLEEMMGFSRRNFLYACAALGVAGLILFRGIYLLHRRSLLEAEKAVAEKKERERFQAISGFAAGVAHEIKNPLNSLALLLEMVQKKAPLELAEDAALGKEEIEKISRIIDRFSDSIKPLTLLKENVLVEDIVREVQTSLEAEARARDVSLRFHQDRPIVLAADRILLAQCLSNILRNSLEATESGLVNVSVSRKKKKVVLRVEDTGRGIPEEDMGRIFEPFYSTKASGMGVGLFLVKKIVEAHGGSIAVSSRPGRGTAFSIEIPGGPS